MQAMGCFYRLPSPSVKGPEIMQQESSMTTLHTSTFRSFKRLLPGAIAALTLFASAQSHAMGDATDAELPWVRPGDVVSTTPYSTGGRKAGSRNGSESSTLNDSNANSGPLTRGEVNAQLMSERAERPSPSGDAFDRDWLPITESRVLGQNRYDRYNSSNTAGSESYADRYAAGGSATMMANDGVVSAEYGPSTRADVRAALETWRAAGLLTPGSEIGDTEETLARREEYYAQQTEMRLAEVAAAEQEAQALAQLQADGASQAMLAPSADGMLMKDASGNELLIVEIDD